MTPETTSPPVPDPESSPSAPIGWPIWILISAALLAVAILFSGAFPRYTYTLIPDGVLVFDQWTGQFQQLTIAPSGDVTASQVIRPF